MRSVWLLVLVVVLTAVACAPGSHAKDVFDWLDWIKVRAVHLLAAAAPQAWTMLAQVPSQLHGGRCNDLHPRCCGLHNLEDFTLCRARSPAMMTRSRLISLWLRRRG